MGKIVNKVYSVDEIQRKALPVIGYEVRYKEKSSFFNGSWSDVKFELASKAALKFMLDSSCIEVVFVEITNIVDYLELYPETRTNYYFGLMELKEESDLIK